MTVAAAATAAMLDIVCRPSGHITTSADAPQLFTSHAHATLSDWPIARCCCCCCWRNSTAEILQPCCMRQKQLQCWPEDSLACYIAAVAAVT
jgi:hypothetical protein